MTYKYYSPRRPITPGIITGKDKDIILSIENYDEPMYIPEIGRSAWGCVVCSKNLYGYEKYDLIEEKKYRRDLMPGDIIRSRGGQYIIKKICRQYTSESYLGSTPVAECAFYDTSNTYREWYSYKDGGTIEYFDENNLYSLLDEEVMKDTCEQCVDVLRSSGIYSDDALVYFVIRPELGKAKLYKNSRYFGYVDLRKDDEQDELFKNLIMYLQDTLGDDIKFFAFGNTVTGGVPIVKTETSKGIVRLSWLLDREKVKVRVVSGSDVSIEELNFIAKCCVDEHMVYENVEKRLCGGGIAKFKFSGDTVLERFRNNEYSKLEITFD